MSLWDYVRYYIPCGKRKARESPRQESLSGPARRPHKEGVPTMVAAQARNGQTHFPPSGALDTLDQVADRSYAALGSCDGRLARAVAIVRSGAVTLLPSGYVEVQSQSRGELSYTVHGACPCPDAQHRAPHGHCKHLLAAWLVRRVHNALPPGTHSRQPSRARCCPPRGSCIGQLPHHARGQAGASHSARHR